jgi:hypothetical protein
MKIVLNLFKIKRKKIYKIDCEEEIDEKSFRKNKIKF